MSKCSFARTGIPKQPPIRRACHTRMPPGLQSLPQLDHFSVPPHYRRFRKEIRSLPLYRRQSDTVCSVQKTGRNSSSKNLFGRRAATPAAFRKSCGREQLNRQGGRDRLLNNARWRPANFGWSNFGLMPARSNRNQTTDLDDLVTWQIEIIGHVGGVPLHYGEKLFLPPWQPPPVLATGNRLVPDKIGDVGEIDGT